MDSRSFVKWLTMAGIAMFLFPCVVMAAQGSGTDFEVTFTAEFSQDDLLFDRMFGYDVVELSEGGCTREVGKPMLPSRQVRVALPAGMEARSIRILRVEEEEIPGAYMIYPTQPVLHVGETIDDFQFVLPDENAYRSDAPYPSAVVELNGQSDLAGQGMAAITIYPLRYVPADRRLKLLTSIDLLIEGVGGYVCGDYLPRNISPRGRAMYEHMVEDMVANPGDVALCMADEIPRTLGVDPGEYEYVIITQSSWGDDFQPLADWKTKKGVPATIVTTEWIYSEYSGSSNAAKIKAFVEDAHNTWGTIYFLLGGDSDIVPYYTRNISGDAIPGDTYYGDYDYDWTCEIHVGRASASTTSEISTFMDKVFTYEQNPPLTSYGNTAAFFGFDLYTYGSHEGEDCKKDIKSLYVPSGWTYRKEYDSESGSHKSDVIGYMNEGNNLINHIDHCGEDVIGVGCTNHGDLLSTSDIDNLSNGDRQSIFYSIGCWPAAFDYTNCIAEHFVRDTNGGGLAFVGNTRYGWYSPYYDDYYSLRYDRYFFRSLFSQNHTVLGDCFSDHKNDAYESDETYQYIFYELTLLGDPEVPIWTDNPVSFGAVTYPSTIMIGSQDFTVEVEDGGNPVSGARVCLMKDGEVYEVGTTGSSGMVTLSIDPTSQGTMDVTVTAQNYLPYEGTCEISGEAPDVTVTLVPDTTIVHRGGVLGYEVTVTNNSGSDVILDYWTDIILWNGNPYGGNPVFGPFTATVGAYQTRHGHLTHPVPPGAPLRTYTCIGRIGGYPGTVWSEDSFEFTITE
jgi:hypothetical protein